ncbi:MAG: TetR/AcrR family transcriptional regulator [Anaerolineales bacterium]|nr:TetR/AcrR family transcriptional regulator [Anaerolineales bacterium]MDW8161871.1 TetR/AcrR family transcriptional regulator [Anaerolineales bacterium]
MSTQLRSLETRARILAAAVDQFIRFGYEAASVDQICAAAGVSKGAFYHHFPSKQALFLALLENWIQDLEASFETIRDEVDWVPKRFERIAEVLCHVFEQAAGRAPLYLEFWYQATKDLTAWNASFGPYQRFHSIFAEWIEEGIRQGSLKPVDANLAAVTLVSLGVGLVLQVALKQEGIEWGRIPQGAMDLLLEGLLASPDPLK